MTEASLRQVDNLLRFLNAVDTAEELACGFTGALADRATEFAPAILELREEAGPFLALEDLVPLEKLLHHDLPAMLVAARHPLLSEPPLERYAMFATGAAPVLIAGLVATPVLFAIKWEDPPFEWFRKYFNFYQEVISKRQGISIKEAAVEKRLKKLNTAISDAQTAKKKAQAETPPNQTGIDQADRIIDRNTPKAKAADAELKEILREAAALNKALKNKDVQATRKIVEANLKARLTEVKALKAAADRRAAAATDPKEKAKALADVKKYGGEETEIEEDLEKIKKELG